MSQTKIRLGELLLQRGIIDRKQLYKALLDQKSRKIQLGEMLIRLGYVTEKDIHLLLSDQLGYPYIDLDNTRSLPETVSLLPEKKCREKNIIPIEKSNGIITLVMSDPLDYTTIDEVRYLTACEVSPVISSRSSIKAALDRYYSGSTASSKPTSVSRPFSPPASSGPKLPAADHSERVPKPTLPKTSTGDLGIVKAPELSVTNRSRSTPENPDYMHQGQKNLFRTNSASMSGSELLDSIVTDVSGERFLSENLFHDSIDESDEDEIMLETDDTVIDGIFERALQLGSFHILLVSDKNGMQVSWMIDSSSVDEKQLNDYESDSVFTSLKAKASLFFSHSHSFTTGQFKINLGTQKYEIGVALTTTLEGELISLHLSPQEIIPVSIRELGISDACIRHFSKILAQRKGMFIFSGPIASGCTTTLYSFIKSLAGRKKIISVEERLQCVIPETHQIDWKGTDESTLPYYVQNLMPDIIVIKVPVAVSTLFKLANQCLVLTNMAFPTTVDVLTHLRSEMADPMLLSLFLGSLAQRRVRHICARCRQPRQFTPEMAAKYGPLPLEVYYHGQGCSACHHTGYSGQLTLFELLLSHKNLPQLSPKEIYNYNQKIGGTNFREAAIHCLQSGQIGLDDAIRLIYG